MRFPSMCGRRHAGDDPRVLATWVKQIDGLLWRRRRFLDPAWLAQVVKEIDGYGSRAVVQCQGR